MNPEPILGSKLTPGTLLCDYFLGTLTKVKEKMAPPSKVTPWSMMTPGWS